MQPTTATKLRCRSSEKGITAPRLTTGTGLPSVMSAETTDAPSHSPHTVIGPRWPVQVSNLGRLAVTLRDRRRSAPTPRITRLMRAGTSRAPRPRRRRCLPTHARASTPASGAPRPGADQSPAAIQAACNIPGVVLRTRRRLLTALPPTLRTSRPPERRAAGVPGHARHAAGWGEDPREPVSAVYGPSTHRHGAVPRGPSLQVRGPAGRAVYGLGGGIPGRTRRARKIQKCWYAPACPRAARACRP
jgi:hypothetical protein